MINWILVPVHNNVHLTKAAVKTFIKQDIPEVRVLLLNNGSTDGTAEWARTMYPKVVTLYQTPPYSVAQSWNRGLTLLFGNLPQEPNAHVLVCNNDVELRPDTYRLLLEDGGGFVTAVGVDDKEMLATTVPGGKRPNPDFSCYLIRREVWDKVGRFDEKFETAFCEDWDFHVRLHKAGVDAHCIDIPFYHVGSATVNNMPPEEQEAVLKQADKNRQYFKEKWGCDGGSPEYYELFKIHDAH